MVSDADLGRPHDEAAAAVERAADERGAGRLLDRQRLAGDHGFVDGTGALDHLAVDGHPVAWADAQEVAGMDGIERDLLVAAVGAHPARGLGGEAQQRLDGAAGALAGAQLQDLAEQDQ